MPRSDDSLPFARASGQGTSRVPKRLASLIMAYAQARIMQREMRKEDERLSRQSGGGATQSQVADVFRLWTFFNLYLACLHVVIEGWDKTYLYDDKIDDLLRRGYRKQLRAFRNTVFHAAPYDDVRVARVLRRHIKVRQWADELMNSFERFFLTYLQGD